jgi:hypothetical protein
MSMCDNKNPQWELMLFHLNGHKLNDFGTQAYVENSLTNAGCTVVGRHEHLKLSERLHKPDWRDAFLAS